MRFYRGVIVIDHLFEINRQMDLIHVIDKIHPPRRCHKYTEIL